MVEGYRLSFQQQHLWHLQTAAAPSVASAVVDLQGAIQAETLRRALGVVIGRHEALRTRVEQPAGLNLPLQVVEETREPRWCEMQVDGDAAARAAVIARALDEAKQAASAGTVAGSLIMTGPRAATLVVAVMSLCADDVSLRTLIDEILFVSGNCGERLTDVAALTQYPSFSEWQHSLVDDEYGQGAREVWSARDLRETPSQSLPLEMTAPAGHRDAATARVPVTLPTDILERIELACGASGVSLEIFLLATWHTLMHRLSGRRAWTVGVQVSGRSFQELHGAIGPFAHVVPIAGDFEGRRSFAEVLRAIQDEWTRVEPWMDHFDWRQVTGDAATGEAPGPCPLGFRLEDSWVARSVNGLTAAALTTEVQGERHRLQLQPGAIVDGFRADDLLDEVLSRTEVPR